jgi:hypothetical protein
MHLLDGELKQYGEQCANLTRDMRKAIYLAFLVGFREGGIVAEEVSQGARQMLAN